MKYSVELASPVFDSYRCQRAANALDIDVKKKSVHKFTVDADIETDYNVGLIVGASGSGKTTLAESIYGVSETVLDDSRPIIEQFPEHMDYEACSRMLNGIGLTSVPCWIRPVATLSNGQRARAEIALKMCSDEPVIVVDEWTSVVDRTVGKIMSHCVQKFARSHNRKIILLSCHYDVIDWLMPDWIIDCNKESYQDRRSLRQSRAEQLKFDIRFCDRDSWRYFSKYHYLSDKLPGGHIKLFGLYHGQDQIGFQCFANYVPHRNIDKQKKKMKMHSNRTVIHPDYVGLGMGIKLINITSAIMFNDGYDVWAKFTSIPVYKAFEKNRELWELKSVKRQITSTVIGGNMLRDTGFREKVKVFSYQWRGAVNAEG